MRAARAWGVRRVVTASTIGVYAGVPAEGALSEDQPLPMAFTHAIPTFKKITELAAGHLSSVTDVEIVSARISGTWGPGGHLPDPFFPAPSLIEAAARHREPDLSGQLAPGSRRGRPRPDVRQGHRPRPWRCCSWPGPCGTAPTTSPRAGRRAPPT
ncbi:hypothetical protein JCM9957A_21930 [Kineosporia succinea]